MSTPQTPTHDLTTKLTQSLQKYKSLQEERSKNNGCLKRSFEKSNVNASANGQVQRRQNSPFHDELGPSNLKSTTKSQLRAEKEQRERHEERRLRDMKKDDLKRLRRQDREEREERRAILRDAGGVNDEDTSETHVWAPVNSDVTTPTSQECHIQVRLLNGSLSRTQFDSVHKLVRICEYALQRAKEQDEEDAYRGGITLTTAYPRRTFTLDELQSMNLQEAKLCPNGAVIVTKLLGGYELTDKPLYEYAQIMLPPWRLKGDTRDQQEEFRQKMMDEETQKKREEKKASKKALNAVRRKIKQDMEDRLKRKRGTMEGEESAQKSSSISGGTTTSSSTTASSSANCTLQVRLPNGSALRLDNLHSESTLSNVVEELHKQGAVVSSSNFTLLIPFPRREFSSDSFSSTTLAQARLVPRGSLVVNAPKKETPVEDSMEVDSDYEDEDM